MKFCTQQQIVNWMNVTWSEMKKLHWTDSDFGRTYFLLLIIIILIITEFYIVTFLVCDAVVVYCFSGCWHGCWAGGVINSAWRQNRVPVRNFASRRFSGRNTKRSRWLGWDLTSSWLGDESGCDKTCQQPCSLLHLYDVGSTHESAWSVAQSATQRHCRRETLYFPLRCHPRCLCQETHLATDWLPPQSELLHFCSK